MRLFSRNFILTAVITLTILLLCPGLHANTLISLSITSNPYGVYGPYYATIGTTPNLAIFCEDGDKGVPTQGYLTKFKDFAQHWTDTNPATGLANQEREEEAILLASWAMAVPNKTQAVLIPYQLAIWSVMGSLGGYTGAYNGDTTAQGYKASAIAAVGDQVKYGINSAFMSTVEIFTPASWVYDVNGNITTIGTDQRFIVFTPEPGTIVLLGTGVLLLALGRIRRRRA
jgi:hypothetical protein